MYVLDVLTAYNGELYVPSLIWALVLLLLGAFVTFSRHKMPLILIHVTALLTLLGTLCVSWLSMLRMRSILFSNDVHLPIREYIENVQAAVQVLLALNGASWCLVGWIISISIVMRFPKRRNANVSAEL